MVLVFKASNIKISVLVVLCCTCLFQSYNSTAATAPLLCFVAAATAPPLLIGATTRNFTPFVFFRAMSPKPNGKATGSIPISNASPPDMAMKLLLLLLLSLRSFLLSLILVSAADVSDRFRTAVSYFSFNLGPRPSLAKGCSNLVVLRPVVEFGESFEAYGINGFSFQGKRYKNISFGGVVLHRREVSTASCSCIYRCRIFCSPSRFCRRCHSPSSCHWRQDKKAPWQSRNESKTSQKHVTNRGNKATYLHFLLRAPSFFSQPMSPKPNGKATGSIPFFMLPDQTWLWNRRRCSYYC